MGSERRSRRGAACDGTVHHAGQRPRLRIMQELYNGRYLGAIREWLEINDFAAQVTVQHVYFARLRELYSAVGAQHLRFADMRELYNESRQHGDTATRRLCRTAGTYSCTRNALRANGGLAGARYAKGVSYGSVAPPYSAALKSRTLSVRCEDSTLPRTMRFRALSASSWSASHRWPSSTSVAGSA